MDLGPIFEEFGKRDRYGIGLFSCRAGATPYLKGTGIADLLISELGQENLIEKIEVINLAEEEGVIRRNRIDEVIELAVFRVLPEETTVVLDSLEIKGPNAFPKAGGCKFSLMVTEVDPRFPIDQMPYEIVVFLRDLMLANRLSRYVRLRRERPSCRLSAF